MERARGVLTIDQREWEQWLVRSACDSPVKAYSESFTTAPVIDAPSALRRDRPDHEIVRRLFNSLVAIPDMDPNLGADDPRYIKYAIQKSHYIRELVKDIKNNRKYGLLSHLPDAVIECFGGGKDSVSAGFISHDVGAIFLLLGTSKKFLAGTRGRPTFKDVELPDLDKGRYLPI